MWCVGIPSLFLLNNPASKYLRFTLLKNPATNALRRVMHCDDGFVFNGSANWFFKQANAVGLPPLLIPSCAATGASTLHMPRTLTYILSDTVQYARVTFCLFKTNQFLFGFYLLLQEKALFILYFDININIHKYK